MQNVALHIGHAAWFRSHVSLSLSSWRLANHLAKHEPHHIGLQKQFVQLCSRSWEHRLSIFTSGVFVMQAKQVSVAAGARYLGFFSISATKTSTNLSIKEVWNLTDDKTTIGRFILSWRSLKSSELIRIEKLLTPSLVGFTCIFTNCTESVVSCIEMLCESLLSAIKAVSDWWAKCTKYIPVFIIQFSVAIIFVMELNLLTSLLFFLYSLFTSSATWLQFCPALEYLCKVMHIGWFCQLFLL